MIGIDVLTDEAHLANTRGGQHFDFGDNLFDRPRDLGAPCIRHHAERAEFVAAFLHRDKGGDAAFADNVRFWRGQVIELALGGKIRVENGARDFGAAQKLRQAVIALRSDDDIHRLLPPENLRPLGLRDAARDDDLGLLPSLGTRRLERAQLAQFGEHLLAGALPYVAGIQHHKIGFFQMRGRGIALRRENIGHPLRIINIHLTAVRLHEQPAGGFHRIRSWFPWNLPGGTRFIELRHRLPLSTRRSPLYTLPGLACSRSLTSSESQFLSKVPSDGILSHIL